jgi:hypothetical protein
LVAAFVILLSLACTDRGKQPTENPQENLPPSTPTTISPADGAVNVSPDFVLTWESIDPEGDNMEYWLYFGPDSIPSHTGPMWGRDYYESPWPKQIKARQMLAHIYELQSAYRDQYGSYCLNGVTTRAGDSSFAVLGFYPDSDDVYSYTNIASYNTFTCAATASNLDFDATNDVWVVNDGGTITCTTNDLALDPWDFPYEINTTYYWQVTVRDDHNNQVTGPVSTFTSGPDTLEINWYPTIPRLIAPADGSTGALDEIIFTWGCTDPDGDPLSYDLYFDVDPNHNWPRQRWLTAKYRPSPWYSRAIMQDMMMQIYEGQLAYFGQHGEYGLNGITASYGYDNFAPLGVIIDSLDIYTYTMTVAYGSHFLCTATATNLDDDATTDVWTIDETGELVCIIDDFLLLLEPSNTTYYWRIAARDNHGNVSMSPMRTFVAIGP